MGWKLVFGIFCSLLVVVSLVLIFSGDEKIDYEEEENLKESSPSRVGVSQEKLEVVSQTDGNVEAIEPRVINLGFETVTDTFELKQPREELHLNESIVEVFGYKAYESSMLNFLERDTVRTNNDKDIHYEQKLIFPETLEFEEFEDEDYLDGDLYAGFYIEEGESVIGYSLSFVDAVLWSELRGIFIPFLGHTYYVRSIDGSPEGLELWKEAYQFYVYEGEVVDVVHPTLGLTRMEIDTLKEDSVQFIVDGELQDFYKEGSSYNLSNKLIYLEEIGYSDVTAGFVRLTIASEPIYFGQSEIRDSELRILEDIAISYGGDNDYLDEISVTWNAQDTIIISPSLKQTFPFFETLTISMIGGDYDEDDEYFTVANVTGSKILLKER